MSEFNKNYIKVTEDVTSLALATVDARFGRGFPHLDVDAETPLAYHNGRHTRAVGRGALKVASALGLASKELADVAAASAAHDLVQLKGRGIDEAESAAWLADQLRRTRPNTSVEMGTLAVLGTQPIFEDGQLVGQWAARLEYPSKTTEKGAKSVACGDLGQLYAPSGPLDSHLLWQEIQKTPSLEGLEDFQAEQVALLDRYRYPLDIANSILATHRKEVIAYTELVLDQLRRGQIESWEQLIAQDGAFMRQHQAQTI